MRAFWAATCDDMRKIWFGYKVGMWVGIQQNDENFIERKSKRPDIRAMTARQAPVEDDRPTERFYRDELAHLTNI